MNSTRVHTLRLTSITPKIKCVTQSSTLNYFQTPYDRTTGSSEPEGTNIYKPKGLSLNKVLAVTESRIYYTLITCTSKTVYNTALQLLYSSGVIYAPN